MTYPAVQQIHLTTDFTEIHRYEKIREKIRINSIHLLGESQENLYGIDHPWASVFPGEATSGNPRFHLHFLGS